jgi:hypothetical protein
MDDYNIIRYIIKLVPKTQTKIPDPGKIRDMFRFFQSIIPAGSEARQRIFLWPPISS